MYRRPALRWICRECGAHFPGLLDALVHALASAWAFFSGDRQASCWRVATGSTDIRESW